MKEHHSILSKLWDETLESRGHTGYTDLQIFNYDQPIRLACVEKILKSIAKEKDLSCFNVLDIGCGTGDFIKLSRKYNATVTGLDISSKVIEQTRKRFNGDEKVKLLSGPVSEVELPPITYDIITSITVLQHILNDDELIESLRVLRRSMKANGTLIILELSPSHKEQVIQYNSDVAYLLERPTYIWRAILEKAGFAIESEPVMPQLGISMLRTFSSGLGWLITLIKRKNTLVNIAETSTLTSLNSKKVNYSLFKKVILGCLNGIRKFILFTAWPMDHLFKLSLPSQKFRHYGMFVCKPKQE